MTVLKRLTHPEDGIVYACPHCDSSNVRCRVDGTQAQFDADAPFACYSCKSGVHEPKERESRMDPALRGKAGSKCAKHGPAMTLEAMDVEEFDRHLQERGLA